MVGKVRAGPPHSALNLVEHEQGVMAVCQFASLAREFFGNGKNAALPLYKLEHNTRRVLIHCRFQRADIIAVDVPHTGQ